MSITEQDLEQDAPRDPSHFLATGDQAEPDKFPSMGNLSAGWMFRLLPVPNDPMPPEYAYVEMPPGESEAVMHVRVALVEWNWAWESAQLRRELALERPDFPDQLRTAADVDANIYLVPRTPNRYAAYAPSYHLLPRRVLEFHGLPLLREGTWPLGPLWDEIDGLLPPDFQSRLSAAFASHIWHHLEPGAPSGFSRDEPIKLLAHNLDYWLPHVHAVMEGELRDFERGGPNDSKVIRDMARLQRGMPPGITAQRPRKGGTIWRGEEWAAEVTADVVEHADHAGRLRGILEAIRSNRVHEDFSDRWSWAREDFERRINHKRSKIDVAFMELPESIPVHGPESEVEGKILFEDFMGLLDARERRVVVLLSAGVTRVGELASALGYRGHSPVSKALARIRQKAERFFDESG